MLKIGTGKFHNFVERFKNLLKTYINYDKSPLPLFVDKAVKIVSTLLQYIKEPLAHVASAYKKKPHYRLPDIVLPAATQIKNSGTKTPLLFT